MIDITLTEQQISKIDAALFAAHAEFLELYGYGKNQSEYHYNYLGQVRNACFEYGRKVVDCLRFGDYINAISWLNHAVAYEGDYCGWIDFRAYNTPMLMLLDMLKACPGCLGTGMFHRNKCKICNGTGTTNTLKKVILRFNG